MSVSNPSDASLLFPVLVGDIGGTNARFAILPDPTGASIEFPTVATCDHPGIDEAIAAVLAQTDLRPRSALLAIAAPVRGEEIRLTNCPWVIRPRTMMDTLALAQVVILNDFEAQALAVAALDAADVEQIGGGQPDPEGGRVVLGPGTGLGVAGLVRAGGTWVPVPGEGGHVDIGPRSPRDFEVFSYLERIEGRISGEQLLCGRGLVNLHSAVAAARGDAVRPLSPADITRAALDGSDPIAGEAVEIFVTCLGRLAGDLALVFMARGGVYLSGGITQKILPLLRHQRFRAAFEDKAPHTVLMRQMPVYVVTHPLAALVGLAAYARRPAAFHISTRGRRWQAGQGSSARD